MKYAATMHVFRVCKSVVLSCGAVRSCAASPLALSDVPAEYPQNSVMIFRHYVVWSYHIVMPTITQNRFPNKLKSLKIGSPFQSWMQIFAETYICIYIYICYMALRKGLFWILCKSPVDAYWYSGSKSIRLRKNEFAKCVREHSDFNWICIAS